MYSVKGEAMSRFYDVVVIGAGPAGIFTALELADTGASVLILERDWISVRG